MPRVKISKLKARMSAYIRAAEAGQVIEIMDRSRAVARLGPVASEEHGLELIPAERPFRSVRTVRRPPLKARFNSLRVLRDERGTR